MSLIDFLFHRGNDLTTQFLPDALFFKESILAGRFPVWNPWIFAGIPYLLDPQNLLWYPPNYIFLLLPIDVGFLFLLVGHLILAGVFMARLLRKLPLWARLLGMFLFTFSPKLLSFLEEGNWSLFIASTWLTVLYYSLISRRFRLLVISLSALIINNLNIGYYGVLFVLLFYLVHRKKRGPVVETPVLIKVLLITVLLTLPRWLPLALYGGQTVRANLSEAPLPFWSWTKVAKSLLVPLLRGHPVLQNDEILYVGIVPIILLVLLALKVAKGSDFGYKGRALRNFWIIWLAFVFFVALNVKSPFYWIIEKLPGFSLLRITTRPWIFVSFALALWLPQLVASRGKGGKAWIVLVAGLVLIEQTWFALGLFSRRPIPQPVVPERFYQRMRAFGTPVRAYCTTGCLDRLTAQQKGIALLGGNNPVQLRSFTAYLQTTAGYAEPDYHPILPPYTVFNQHPQPLAKLLGQTATRFVVSPYPLADSRFVEIDAEGDYRLYRNTATIIPYSDHHFPLAIPGKS